MKGNLGWCVVIGKTRMENFSKPREWPIGEPDLSHVGKMVVGSDTHLYSRLEGKLGQKPRGEPRISIGVTIPRRSVPFTTADVSLPGGQEL